MEVALQLGRHDAAGIAWENELEHMREVPLAELLDFVQGGEFTNCDTGVAVSRRTHWAYLSYQHLAALFKDHPRAAEVFAAVDWPAMGVACGGEQSTLWVGTAGARTQCHQDAYGWNLVAQLHGTKRWTLFAPDCAPALAPTRIPYEESSVFAGIDVCGPEAPRCVGMEVDLRAGQVLFVPRHWWHHVLCAEDAVSVNMWTPHAGDAEQRVHEALVRTLVGTCMRAHLTAPDAGQPLDAIFESWLNPSETVRHSTPHPVHSAQRRATCRWRRAWACCGARLATTASPTRASCRPSPVLSHPATVCRAGRMPNNKCLRSSGGDPQPAAVISEARGRRRGILLRMG